MMIVVTLNKVLWALDVCKGVVLETNGEKTFIFAQTREKYVARNEKLIHDCLVTLYARSKYQNDVQNKR